MRIVRGFCWGIVGLTLWAQYNVFADVRLLQRAATPVLPSVGWKDLGSGGGFYGSSQIEIATTGFMPSTLRYSISGRVATRADQALISAFIASPGDLTVGRRKVEDAAVQWFKTTGKPVPSGLAAAIKAGLPFRGVTAGLSVQYTVERGTGNPIRQPDGTSYRCTTMDLKIGPS